MHDELLDILDSKGDKTGEVKSRNLIHSNGSWHATVHIWIYKRSLKTKFSSKLSNFVYNSKIEVLLQKRAVHLYVYPGLWDISCAGHISAGQTPDNAAIRELSEELGIKATTKQLKKVKVQIQRYTIPGKPDFKNNEFNHLYLFMYEGGLNELNFKDGEVGRVKFVSVDEFEKDLSENKQKYVPHNYYPLIIKAIRKELPG